MKKTIKIKNRKGEIHESCPYINYIINITQKYSDLIPAEDLFDFNLNIEKIRLINHALRDENKTLIDLLNCNIIPYRHDNTEMPYNFSAVIKGIKLLTKQGVITEEKIDEIIKTYL